MKYLFGMAFLASVMAIFEFNEEDNVVVLTDNNFDDALKTFPYLMVEFYAPWCVHCQRLAPEYAAAAAALKKEHITLGKVDCTVEKNISSKFMIRGYPTLKFFRNGRGKNYEGRRHAQDIMDWLHLNAVPLVTQIENLHELEQFKDTQKIVMMYFAKGKDKEPTQKIFEQMADQLEGVYFGMAQSHELRQQIQLGVDEKIVLYTPYNPPAKMQGDITLENIWYFVHNHSYPEILSFNKREVFFVEDLKNPAIFLFLDGIKENLPEEQAFNQIAKKLKGEIQFVKMSKGVKEERENWLTTKVQDKFGLKDFPSLYIYDTTNRPFIKYKLKQNITEDSILQFYQDWKERKLEPYYKSQKVPLQFGPVKIIVGKSFQWEVLETDKDVLLLFYAPWDKNSREIQQVLELVARKLEKVPNIVIAKLDATENEVPGFNITSYPTLKFFRQLGPEEDPEVLDYKGERTEAGIIAYLKDHMGQPFSDADLKNVKHGKRRDDL